MANAMIKLFPNVYKRGETIYAVKSVRGKSYRKRCDLQGAFAIDSKGRLTPEMKRWMKAWIAELESAEYLDAHEAKQRAPEMPTWAEFLLEYERCADIEYRINQTPRPSTVKECLEVGRKVLRDLGFALSDRVSLIPEEVFRDYVETLVCNNNRLITAWSTVRRFAQLWAGWAMDRYKAKWPAMKKQTVPKPRGGAIAVVYTRPPEDLINRTVEWIDALEEVQPQVWLAASLMLRCGMRNGDVLSLEWTSFRRDAGVSVLHYMPAKTRVSAGARGVTIPLPTELVDRFERAAGGRSGRLVRDDKVFVIINQGMRELGWKSTKVSYELRKLCVDRVYSQYGAEAAVQVSGDNLNTLSRYYADPSRARRAPFAVF